VDVAEVAFPLPVPQTFDYLIPPTLQGALRPGQRITAPFGHRGAQVGVVLKICRKDTSQRPSAALKSLLTAVDPIPALSEKDILLARRLSTRYFCSIGQAIFCVLPIGKHLPPKRPKVSASAATAATAQKFTLTPDQQNACEKIIPRVEQGGFHPMLLWGVAASGKTEVYLRAIEAALKKGNSALYLVPEIGLTPQVEALLRGRFGDLVEVWHSEIARGDRWRTWENALAGKCRVLLGPRSAVFVPLQNLGLVVMDEEHDPSYKEDSAPRYHAREVALEKGRLHGVPVILGSATPSMESYRRALEGEIALVEMSHRVFDRPAPDVRAADMRRRGGKLLSPELAESIAERLARKEQCLIFLNRRGFSTYVTCAACGWEARCPRCAVSLVFHKAQAPMKPGGELLPAATKNPNDLHCHYCGYGMPLPERCPRCRSAEIQLKGRGTQKIVSELALWFPQARFLRWDRDTTRKKGAHTEAFDAVRLETVDIIVGTQMIAQGLDFPAVTLVGVLDADRTLRFPDFRAGERTFQLLTQVAGRAGRAEKPGIVFLQTRSPDHYAVRAALRLDYKTFAEEELKFRREMEYPPYKRLVQILLRGKTAERVEHAAEELMRWIEERSDWPKEVEPLGPAPSFYVLRAGLTQWQVLLKGPENVMELALSALRDYKPPKLVSLLVDADPEELQ